MLDEFLQSIGYQESQITKIHKIYPSHQYSESTLLYNLKNLYQYFSKNGITEKEFIEITITIPNIIMRSIENIKIQIQELNSLGFHKLDIIEISGPNPLRNSKDPFFCKG